MIRGIHAMFYSSSAEELRAFIRDKLQLRYSDVGEGWLIFDVPEAEIGCHPSDAQKGAPAGTHLISFYCDDIRTTVSTLKARGVVFDDDISEREYGFVVHFSMPGHVGAELYQPRYRKQAVAGLPHSTSANRRGDGR